jgi:hypothetical protein
MLAVDSLQHEKRVDDGGRLTRKGEFLLLGRPNGNWKEN